MSKIKIPFCIEEESTQFKSYWNSLYPDIMYRENLKPSHLLQLKILCNLYIQEEALMKNIVACGLTFRSEGRNGYQEKLRPESQLLERTRTMIREYSKVLGLVLVKDNVSTNSSASDNEWE